MKKLSLFLSTLLFGSVTMAETPKNLKENSIEMTQDGPANKAEVTQQGSGNHVIIKQGGAMPALMGEDVIHLRPMSEKLKVMRREKRGESQRMKIHQHGGGKLEVRSVTGDGKAVTDVKSSPLPSEH
jgi:hypothetical protein